MQVLVLKGGASAERDVSLRSAASVTQALQELGHHVDELDPLTDLTKLSTYPKRPDVVFPVLHGQQGEDGTVQQILEHLSLPFVGSSSAVSQRCFHKSRFLETISALGIHVPHGSLVNQTQFTNSDLITRPFVLKPDTGGSSIDTIICHHPDQANSATALRLFDRHPVMRLEALVSGTEITVPILDNQALPVIEIIPPPGETFDYTNKYNGQTQELCPPQSLSPAIQQQAQHLALSIHQAIGVRHFSRTDMIVEPSGRIVVLELNTIPGLTSASLFPKAAAVAGLSMADLVNRLIQLATKHPDS